MKVGHQPKKMHGVEGEVEGSRGCGAPAPACPLPEPFLLFEVSGSQILVF